MPLELFGTVDTLTKGIDAAQLRQNTIANNIANIDTPGFKASHVEFESYMKQAFEDSESTPFVAHTTRPDHISFDTGNTDGVQAQTVVDDSTSMRMDGNNVDVDAEMTDLAKNNLWHNALVEKINGELERLRIAINGR